MFDDLDFIDGPAAAGQRVSVLALASCAHCEEAMAMLRARGIAYRYLFVDAQAPAARIRIKKELTARYQRHLIFPILELPGGEHVFGWNEDVWRRKLEF